MDSLGFAVVTLIFSGVVAAVVGPLVGWLVTRRSTNKQTNVSEFTAITEALNARVTDLVSQVATQDQKIAVLESRLGEKDKTVATLQAQANGLQAENEDLRGEMGRVKSAVRNYILTLRSAWGKGGAMPLPDPDDMHILETTIPRSTLASRLAAETGE